MKIFKKIATALMVVACLCSLQIDIGANSSDATSEESNVYERGVDTSAKKTEFLINYSEGFKQEEAYTFGLKSKVGGYVSVFLETEIESLVIINSEYMKARIEKVIKIDKMPAVKNAKLVVVVKPENNDYDNLLVSQMKEYHITSSQEENIFLMNNYDTEIEAEWEEEPLGDKQEVNIDESDTTIVTKRVDGSNVGAMSLTMKRQPKKVVFYVGDTVPTEKDLLLGSAIQVTHPNSNSESIFLKSADGDGYTTNYNEIKNEFAKVSGIVELLVTYKDQNLKIPFHIKNIKVDVLEVATYPKKTTYHKGDELDLSNLEIVGKKNNGDVTGTLVEHTDYRLHTKSYNKDALGRYEITIEGIGEYTGIQGILRVSVVEEVDYTKGWIHTTFGQSASTFYSRIHYGKHTNKGEMGAGKSIKLETLRGGSVGESGDGVNFYYKKLKEKENFVFKSKMKIYSFGEVNKEVYGSYGFGLMFRDSIAKDQAGNPITGVQGNYPSSIFFAGALGNKQQFQPIYRDNRLVYLNNKLSWPQVVKTNENSYLNFERNPEVGKETIAEVIIKRSNNTMSGSFTVNGETRTFNYDNNIPFDYYDKEHNYLGFFTAGNSKIEFYDSTLEVTDSQSDPVGPKIQEAEVKPKLTIRSDVFSSMPTYNLIFVSNANGTAIVKHNNEVVGEVDVLKNKLSTIPTNLKGNDTFEVVLIPSVDDNYSSYDKVSAKKKVEYKAYEGDIYVSNRTDSGGVGTKEDPMHMLDAIKLLKPGHTIYMLPGIYTQQYWVGDHNGSTKEDGYKKIEALPGAKIIGEKGKNLYFSIHGDFWHVKGLVIEQGSIRVYGNNNIIELSTVRGSLATGIAISGSAKDENIYNNKDMWPSNNLILNSESFDNRDSSEGNADGFAASINIGEGNRFVGCVAHHNIDDGFDLFAKVFEIGEVHIDHSIAYRNGYTLQPFNGYGDGVGFKLGGGGVNVNHKITNSITFENHADGLTSNSSSSLIAENIVSFNNKGANIFIFGSPDVFTRNYKFKNIFSYKTTAEVGRGDYIEQYVDGELKINDLESLDSDGSIYIYDKEHDSKAKESKNKFKRVVDNTFFESVEPPHLEDYRYQYQSEKSNVKSMQESRVIAGDFLKLKETAYNHENKKIYTVVLDSNGGAFDDGSIQREVSLIEGDSLALPMLSKVGYQFLGWFNEDGKNISSGMKAQGNLKLTARWKKIVETPTVKPTVASRHEVVYTMDKHNRNGYYILGLVSVALILVLIRSSKKFKDN